MASVVQLSLDFGEGAPLAKVVSLSDSCAAQVDTRAALDAAAMRQQILSEVLNPCAHCELADFCGHDDCAMHGFPLDIKEPEDFLFEDFLTMDNFEYCNAITY